MELGVTKVGSSGLVEDMKILSNLQPKSSGRKAINSELWHGCAGPLVTLPQPGSLVYYFPQGHSEQLTASTRRTANAHIPSYPCLPSQMMCQVHDVTLHADKESDEIYAQMTLQPVNSENDVFPIPDFGLTKSKQPREFFCKTLTASDTSTHGGFSVPRRAAEKLFPQLDYSMQPPNQELVVQDLHDNTWTFRHIYRGQPKRHLLTTGWSVFVGAKRLKAGDSVLFIRGDKSQLMLGIRHANHHQTMLPSSVLSADSMHMGVLAAAAHAAANRTKFVIYYNPRACPSEFVVPLAKYHRAAAYGTQVSTGMRFGMMFETEDSNKRRYMGTVLGISDLDQLRWPNSKWRNLQVEWDENGCIERPVRVSLWEIECPDNPFVFSSSASSLKRSYPGFFGWENMIRNPLLANRETRFNSNLHPVIIPGLNPEVLIKTVIDQNNVLHNTLPGSHPQSSSYYSSLVTPACVAKMENLGQEYITSEGALSVPTDQCQNEFLGKVITQHVKDREEQRLETSVVEITDHLDNFSEMNLPVQQQQQKQQQLEESEQVLRTTCIEDSVNSENLTNHSVYANSNFPSMIFETNILQPAEADSSIFADTNGNADFPSQSDQLLGGYMDGLGWMLNPSNCQSNFQEDIKAWESMNSKKLDISGSDDIISMNQEMFGEELLDQISPLLGEQASDQHLGQYPIGLVVLPEEDHGTSSYGLKELADGSRNLSVMYSIDYDDSNGSTLVDPSMCSTSQAEGLGRMWDSGLTTFPTPCNVTYNLHQDVQSQATTTNTSHDFPGCSSGNTSVNLADEICENSNLMNKGSSWKKAGSSVRTYTKVQKQGSVGRSIDVTRFKDYIQLKRAIANMFGLQTCLDDPRGLDWKLVYMDFENDVLLVGDDPWEEFVRCVRCIRILSPGEVQQMSREDV